MKLITTYHFQRKLRIEQSILSSIFIYPKFNIDAKGLRVHHKPPTQFNIKTTLLENSSLSFMLTLFLLSHRKVESIKGTNKEWFP